MEEFKSFNLKTVKRSEYEEKKSDYVSQLGNISWQQERLILFGRSSKFIFLNFILLLAYGLTILSVFTLLGTDLSVLNGTEDKSYFWVKVIAIIGLGVSSITPIAVTMISIGCKKVNLNLIEKGLGIIRILIYIGYAILGIATIGFGLLMLFMLFSAFIVVIFVGLILFFIFKFYFSFLNKSKEFIDGLIYVVGSRSKEKHYIPLAVSLKIYLIVSLVFSTTVTLLQMGDNDEYLSSTNQEVASLFYNLEKFSGYDFALGLITSIFIIYLLGKFDSFISVAEPKKKKIETYKAEF